MTSTMAAPAGTDEATTTTPMAQTLAAASVGGPREGRAKRRTFTTEYKRRIVAEYGAAPSGAKGAVLRRERLYDSHVQEWRAAIAGGTLDEPSKGGPAPQDHRAGPDLGVGTAGRPAGGRGGEEGSGHRRP